MKQELSSMDLHFLMQELKSIEGGSLGKTYSSDKKQIFIQIYQKDLGKKFLTYYHPFIWLGVKKPAGKLSNFATFLRKYYERAKIVSINQVGSERIIELIIQKEQTAKIFFELFGQGNIIICDENNIILYPLEVQEWGDRLIKKGQKYDWFKNNKNFFESTEKNFRNLEIKENISKTLAITFSLGGVFAEELCLRAGIEPKNEKVNQKEKKKLHDCFTKLLREKLNPQLVYKNSNLKDINPIKLEKYSSLENKPVNSFSEALEGQILILEEAPVENAKIAQLQKRIQMQDEVFQKYKKQIEENTKKAEFIYNNYDKIELLLKKGKELLKSQAVNEKIKLDRKNKRILVEV